MAKKGENIYKRKDGRYEGRYIKSRDENGKIQYGYVYDRKLAVLKAKLTEKKQQYASYRPHTKSYCGTLTNWLAPWSEKKSKTLKPASCNIYRRHIQNHILPILGDHRLEKLTPDTLRQFVQSLTAKGLAPSTVHSIFRTLNSALQDAAKTHAIDTNPCEDISLPKAEKTKTSVLTDKNQETLEKVAENDKHGTPVMLSLATGMRVGEICALKWDDVDLDGGFLHVNQTMQRIQCKEPGVTKTEIVFGTPKTATSRRTIPLPAYLIAHLKKCKENSTSEYVVSSKGSFAEPRLVTYWFQKILKKAGLPSISFHTLRHTFATRCMELSADVTSVSKLLGHASAKMTLDVYTDSLMEQRIKTMQRLDQRFAKRM